SGIPEVSVTLACHSVFIRSVTYARRGETGQKGAQMIASDFVIETEKSREEVEAEMRKLEPWRVHVTFSNGFETSELETIQPWNPHPLNKLRMLMEHAGEDVFQSARVLDIGFNAGYNSIALTQQYGCDVVGVDNNPLNLRKAEALTAMAGVAPKFLIADAQEFTDEPFDVVLHLGTLYHLEEPVRSMRTAAANLKPGGWLFLETVGYNGTDPLDARMIYGFFGDKTNFWALGEGALRVMLELAGFTDTQVIRTVDLKIYEGTGLNRIILSARKAD
ncbi:MAG: class I SAM-dependent methyltransferase, partial [Pseudomonadota bacterium]